LEEAAIIKQKPKKQKYPITCTTHALSGEKSPIQFWSIFEYIIKGRNIKNTYITYYGSDTLQ